ncbi:MAG: flagellar biosynthetic protein FliR [Eubacteriales bacterium]
MIIDLQPLILIFIRITAFIVLCPVFSYKGLPNIIKIALSVSFTWMIYMIIPSIELPGEYLAFSLLVIKELLLGLALGFVVKLIFSAIEIAGQHMDFQVGYSMANVYDPIMGRPSAMYSTLYYWLSICIFFMLDLHHQVILALINSFQYIPLTKVNLNGATVKVIIIIFGTIFKLAFNIAIPLIIVVLITDIVMGVVSKTVPQINVLMLGMPLKSMVGLVITFLLISSTMRLIGDTLNLIPEYLEKTMTLFK